MLKRILPVFLISIVVFSVSSFAEEQKASEQPVVSNEQPKTEAEPQGTSQSVSQEEVIKGVIKEIAVDGSFVVVNDTKILTTKEFLDDSYLEAGDNVEITAEKSEQGLKAKSYNYIFEEEGPTSVPEESSKDTIEDTPQGY
ncbi:MAG: hypothetical protein WC412_04170 [Candidatus Omnitrophota bacterium]|jgi:hypothetical protein